MDVDIESPFIDEILAEPIPDLNSTGLQERPALYSI